MQLRSENNELREKNSSLEVLVHDMQEEYEGVKKQFSNFENSSTQVSFTFFFFRYQKKKINDIKFSIL